MHIQPTPVTELNETAIKLARELITKMGLATTKDTTLLSTVFNVAANAVIIGWRERERQINGGSIQPELR